AGDNDRLHQRAPITLGIRADRSADPLDLDESVQLLGRETVRAAPVRRIDAHSVPRPQSIELRSDLAPDLTVLERDHVAVRHRFLHGCDGPEKLLLVALASLLSLLAPAEPEIVRVRRTLRLDLALGID